MNFPNQQLELQGQYLIRQFYDTLDNDPLKLPFLCSQDCAILWDGTQITAPQQVSPEENQLAIQRFSSLLPRVCHTISSFDVLPGPIQNLNNNIVVMSFLCSVHGAVSCQSAQATFHHALAFQFYPEHNGYKVSTLMVMIESGPACDRDLFSLTTATTTSSISTNKSSGGQGPSMSDNGSNYPRQQQQQQQRRPYNQQNRRKPHPNHRNNNYHNNNNNNNNYQ